MTNIPPPITSTYSGLETTGLGNYAKHKDSNLGNIRRLVFGVYPVLGVIVCRPEPNIRHPIIATP